MLKYITVCNQYMLVNVKMARQKSQHLFFKNTWAAHTEVTCLLLGQFTLVNSHSLKGMWLSSALWEGRSRMNSLEMRVSWGPKPAWGNGLWPSKWWGTRNFFVHSWRASDQSQSLDANHLKDVPSPLNNLPFIPPLTGGLPCTSLHSLT